MAYRNDFYIAENIIGYTGNLLQNPTVYFYHEISQAFGRITQSHPNKRYIGRSFVRHSPDYAIKNDGINGWAQEFYNGKVRHKSRHPFNDVGSFISRCHLCWAIIRFRNVRIRHQ